MQKSWLRGSFFVLDRSDGWVISLFSFTWWGCSSVITPTARLNVLVRTADRRLMRYDVLMWWMGTGLERLQKRKLMKTNYGVLLVTTKPKLYLIKNHTCASHNPNEVLGLRTSQSSSTFPALWCFSHNGVSDTQIPLATPVLTYSDVELQCGMGFILLWHRPYRDVSLFALWQ